MIDDCRCCGIDCCDYFSGGWKNYGDFGVWGVFDISVIDEMVGGGLCGYCCFVLFLNLSGCVNLNWCV